MKLPEHCRALWALREGDSGVVEGFGDNISEAYRIRLMEFGFHPGETVSCLLTPGVGAPHVYRVSNTVFSLDEDLSAHVYLRITDSTSGSPS